VITVELGEGRLVRISAGAPAVLVSATLKVLR
jgi:transposase